MQACRSVDSVEGSLVGLVQSVFAKFKDEMLEAVRYLVAELTKEEVAAPSRIAQKGINTASRENGNVPDSNVRY